MTTEDYNLTLEQLSKIISNGKLQLEVVTASPEAIDYLIAMLPALSSLVVMYLTFRIFKERMNDFKEQIKISKDTDRFYEAADLCFSFFDASSLLFSMNEKKSIRLQKEMDDGLGFEQKFQDSNSRFYQTIEDAHKAAFIFRSMKMPIVAEKIDTLRDQIIITRKEQAGTIETENEEGLLKITKNYSTLKAELKASKSELYDLIVASKPE